jgi:hypothetical protein
MFRQIPLPKVADNTAPEAIGLSGKLLSAQRTISQMLILSMRNCERLLKALFECFNILCCKLPQKRLNTPDTVMASPRTATGTVDLLSLSDLPRLKMFITSSARNIGAETAG